MIQQDASRMTHTTLFNGSTHSAACACRYAQVTSAAPQICCLTAHFTSPASLHGMMHSDFSRLTSHHSVAESSSISSTSSLPPAEPSCPPSCCADPTSYCCCVPAPASSPPPLAASADLIAAASAARTGGACIPLPLPCPSFSVPFQTWHQLGGSSACTHTRPGARDSTCMYGSTCAARSCRPECSSCAARISAACCRTGPSCSNPFCSCCTACASRCRLPAAARSGKKQLGPFRGSHLLGAGCVLENSKPRAAVLLAAEACRVVAAASSSSQKPAELLATGLRWHAM
ncbi:hypothetical protein COO60DRAFT_1562106 [Scenedesmus sp. NREL 46B-D3]|nr:hypothetical protein COO60DRAFT_1562106 [Scenedesmus sp. NREL 46B-D3]